MNESAVLRCPWAEQGGQIYLDYHDTEWGVPLHDDRKLFEFVILEGAQAGLSWLTILRRREGYRQAFANFDPTAVANFTEDDVARLLADPGIIRNRAKVTAAIKNARIFRQIQQEFGSFAAYQWQFVGGQPIEHAYAEPAQVPAITPEAEQLSKDLYRRGFRFFGPIIAYAHMQACGLVNDHIVNCFRYQELTK